MKGACYVGVVRKSVGSDYGVDFPDVPGCNAAAKTLAQARRMAAEALALHLDGMAADGAAIPSARTLGEIRDDPECQDAMTLILVPVRLRENESGDAP